MKELQSSSSSSFEAIIAPLERKAGRSLADPGLTFCRLAHEEDAVGFGRLAADAYERGRNPLALLVHVVRLGEHRTRPELLPVNPCGCTHAGCRYQDRCQEAA